MRCSPRSLSCRKFRKHRVCWSRWSRSNRWPKLWRCLRRSSPSTTGHGPRTSRWTSSRSPSTNRHGRPATTKHSTRSIPTSARHASKPDGAVPSARTSATARYASKPDGAIPSARTSATARHASKPDGAVPTSKPTTEQRRRWRSVRFTAATSWPFAFQWGSSSEEPSKCHSVQSRWHHGCQQPLCVSNRCNGEPLG